VFDGDGEEGEVAGEFSAAGLFANMSLSCVKTFLRFCSGRWKECGFYLLFDRLG
jgi:hypothetical protein